MKTVKMSLANLEGKLSRKEMKRIMAGSGGSGSYGGNCDGSVGSWYGNTSMQDCINTIATYCRSGYGHCYPLY